MTGHGASRNELRALHPHQVGGSPQLWGYAATFGAMWGAMEVTVGTFLHSVRVPLAGVVLASVGMALLVALRTIHRQPGVLLAAGVVCAGVKLLSPAGAVVGPVVAIIAESVVAEMLLGLFGPRHVSVAAAGALAAVGALVQKLLTQMLLYGMPVLGIYVGLLRRAEGWFGVSKHGGWWLVGAMVAFVALVGMGFALAGRWVGDQARERMSLNTRKVT